MATARPPRRYTPGSSSALAVTRFIFPSPSSTAICITCTIDKMDRRCLLSQPLLKIFRDYLLDNIRALWHTCTHGTHAREQKAKAEVASSSPARAWPDRRKPGLCHRGAVLGVLGPYPLARRPEGRYAR